MEKLSKKMTEIIVSIDNLICDVKPFINGFLRKEKELELETIEKKINSFSFSKKPIPESLFKEKESLRFELEKIENVQKDYSKFLFLLKVFLNEMLFENVPITGNKLNNEKLYKASLHPDFMKNLVIKGVLRPGAEIERNCNGRNYKGKILPDGKISVKGDSKELVFETIHSAAKHFAEKEVNGLDFWRTRNTFNKLVRLSVFLK